MLAMPQTVAHNRGMSASSVNLPKGLFQCANSAECQRIMDQYMAHWRLLQVYLPLTVLVVLIVPGLFLLGKRLKVSVHRRQEIQKLQLLLVFAGVIVMAAIAKPLAGLIHLWSVDAILGGLALWGFVSIAVVSRTRPPPGRRK